MTHTQDKSFHCDDCGKVFRSQNGLKMHKKESCKSQETTEEDHIQAYMIVKDGEQYFQLEDGQLLPVEETIYTIRVLVLYIMY